MQQRRIDKSGFQGGTTGGEGGIPKRCGDIKGNTPLLWRPSGKEKEKKGAGSIKGNVQTEVRSGGIKLGKHLGNVGVKGKPGGAKKKFKLI